MLSNELLCQELQHAPPTLPTTNHKSIVVCSFIGRVLSNDITLIAIHISKVIDGTDHIFFFASPLHAFANRFLWTSQPRVAVKGTPQRYRAADACFSAT